MKSELPCFESLRDYAKHRGYDVGLNWIAYCPECKAHTRHTKSGDRRGAVGIVPSSCDMFWHCFQCGTGGGLAKYIELDGGEAEANPVKSKVAYEVQKYVGKVKKYIPEYMMDAVFLYGMDSIDIANRWAQIRGWKRYLYSLPGSVKALWDVHPTKFPGVIKRNLFDKGYDMLFLGTDIEGRLAAITGRAARKTVNPKAGTLKGYTRAATVLLDDVSITKLRTGVSVEELIIVEGEPDFLACWDDNKGSGKGVMGIHSSSSPHIFVDKLKPSVVTWWAHGDKAGEDYLASFRNQVTHKFTLQVEELPEGKDYDDIHCKGETR